jgi:hypothetical protein
LWQLVGIFSACFDILGMGFSLTVILIGYNEIKPLSQGRSPRDACRAAEIFPLSNVCTRNRSLEIASVAICNLRQLCYVLLISDA